MRFAGRSVRLLSDSPRLSARGRGRPRAGRKDARYRQREGALAVPWGLVYIGLSLPQWRVSPKMQGEGRGWEPRGRPRSTVPAGRATWRPTRPTAIKVKKDFSQTPIRALRREAQASADDTQTDTSATRPPFSKRGVSPPPPSWDLGASKEAPVSLEMGKTHRNFFFLQS